MTRHLFLAAAFALAAACPSSGGSVSRGSTDPSAEDYVSPQLPHGTVVLSDAYGGKHVVDVEIAATHDARTRGLMWRTNLPEGKGMLFIFAEDEPHSFWMRNTLIPLDMLFIARELRIVGVVENAVPRTLTARGTDAPSRYVLEVPGGWVAKIGLKRGSSAELHVPPGIVAEP